MVLVPVWFIDDVKDMLTCTVHEGRGIRRDALRLKMSMQGTVGYQVQSVEATIGKEQGADLKEKANVVGVSGRKPPPTAVDYDEVEIKKR